MAEFPDHVPVLIIGGSSVGLCAGMFLSRAEIPVLVVERHAGLSAHPRATAISQRSRELFREVGLEQRVLDASQDTKLGGKIKVANLADADLAAIPRARRPRAELAQETASFTPAVLGGPCPQHRLDPILLDGLHEQGGQIRFSVELVNIEQDADLVTATLRDRVSGEQHVVTADYVVAADGAGGPVRELLGIGATGRGGIGDQLVNMLFDADLSELVGGFEFTVCEIDSPTLSGGLLPVDHGGTSWVFHTACDESQQLSDFTPERCAELVRTAVGVSDLKVDVRSVLPWRMAARLADEFRSGRVFLVGDAAHLTPPMGGFGLNTGLADAHNLAWKLAFVLRGLATPALLDSYQAERRPVAEFAMQQALLRLDHPALHWDDKAAAERARVGMANLNIAHIGYCYSSDAIDSPRTELPSTEDVELCLDGSPGTRVPHGWLHRDGKRVSTIDLIEGHFTLLAGPDGETWCAAALAAGTELGVDIGAYRVGGDGLVDEGDWAGRAGLKATGAVLVRPDGFVCWRSPQDGSDDLVKVLARILGR